MTDHYSPTKSDKFSFGLWTVMNVGKDPFGDETRPALSWLDANGEVGKRKV